MASKSEKLTREQRKRLYERLDAARRKLTEALHEALHTARNKAAEPPRVKAARKIVNKHDARVRAANNIKRAAITNEYNAVRDALLFETVDVALRRVEQYEAKTKRKRAPRK